VEEVKNLSTEEKVYSFFSYFWILCLVSLAIKRDSEFVAFHIRQGVVLLIIGTVTLPLVIVPVIGGIVYGFIGIICSLISVVAMVLAVMGYKWEIPVIIDWAKKIKV
jgi:uncharacterized membrane protein